MFNQGRKRFFSIVLLGCVINSGIIAQSAVIAQMDKSSVGFSTDDILHQGIIEIGRLSLGITFQGIQLDLLEAWFATNPSVVYASRIKNSITVKFIDGSSTVVMDPFLKEPKSSTGDSVPLNHYGYGETNGSSAVLLNPDEDVYGHRQCQRIITTLLQHDYHIEYLANDAVTLSYLRKNLSTDIIYMNTHAGYFDTDGDHQADAVVIATGEPWTNETEQTYSFEYQHQMIVKGMIGQKSIIAFTPAFITYYYPPETLPDTLVYMATCFATYDSSMATAFLDAGASAYLGWSDNTVFWINSKTSILSFHLFAHGWTVHHVCTLIRYGGMMNRLFHSKLTYYGDGQHQIPR
jgi:hypothetical protein